MSPPTPPPAGNMDTKQLRQRRTENTTTASGSATSKPRKIMSKKQRMLRDMVAQERADREQNTAVASFQNQAYSSMFQSYLKMLLLLLTVACCGFGYIWTYHPSMVRNTQPRLQNRNLMTLYPPNLHIKRDLPRFYNVYSIATNQNLPARQAVQKVAAVRRIVADAGVYNQGIVLHAWEHEDFSRQLPTANAMDKYCGPGFAVQYQAYKEQQQHAAEESMSNNRLDDLLYWCMLQTGQHDGFVHWNVTVESSLTRGMKGVAAVYTVNGVVRVRPLFLLAPVRHRIRDAGGTSWSTLIPYKMLQWLLTMGIKYEADVDYQAAYETFLYRSIELENTDERWVLLHAACTLEERTALDATQRRLTTDCSLNATDTATCCSIYDPALKPYRVRRRHSDDDDDHEDDAARRKRLKMLREARNESQQQQPVDGAMLRH